MIKSLLTRYPLKRVVLVADRGLLSVNNLDELAKLQTTGPPSTEIVVVL